MMGTKDDLEHLIEDMRQSIDKQAISAIDKGRLRSRITDFESEVASIKWSLWNVKTNDYWRVQANIYLQTIQREIW